MKRGKKSVITAIALALLLGLLAGCATGSEEPDSKGNTAAPSQPAADDPAENSGAAGGSFDEHMDISVSFFNIGKAFPDRNSDELLKQLESKFNVTFVDKVISYSDYAEKYQLWSASGELPDVFSHDIVNKNTYFSWIEQGIIRALPDDLSPYPNVEKVMATDEIKGLNVDGKYYMIPRQTYENPDMWAMERALIVRKDWMQKLNLAAPVTYQDYLNMLRAFAKNDPDGNSKADTVGVTLRSATMLLPLATGTLPNANNGSWLKENGRYIPFYASEKMKEVAKQMRELYAEGAIDPDFAVMKTNDGIEKFGQGKVGAISMQATPNGLKKLHDAWGKYNPGVDFADSVQVIPVSWAAEDGKVYRHHGLTFWSESYFSSKVDDAKMDRILRIYDYLLSDEFITMRRYGLEGKDFTREGDKIVIQWQKDESGNYKGLWNVYPSLNLFGSLAAWYQWTEFEENEVNFLTFTEKLVKMSIEGLNHSIANHEPVPTNFAIELLYTPEKAKLSAINPTEDLIKVMLSKEDPVAMWEEIVKGYNNKGLQKAIDEVNAAIQEQGLDK